MIFELLAISIFINIFVFVIAFILQTDKLTDITYTTTFIVVALIALLSNQITTTKIILFLTVSLWGIRLGTYLGKRIHRLGSDKRFDDMRPKFFSFLLFWLLQGLAVWVILIPTLMVMNTSLTIIDIMTIIGVIIWIIGFLFEAIADYQMNAFHKKKRGKTEFMTKGLWSISRHPNYFGEILCWIGIYFICISSLTITQSLIALISPIFISTLIIFVSGLPQTEKAKEKKYGELKKYQDYKNNTAILIPWVKL